jgi:cytochrome b involved in lipid metabolism
MNALPIITLEQLAEHHAKAATQWIAIDGKVLDITHFQFTHPGGRNAGRISKLISLIISVRTCW